MSETRRASTPPTQPIPEYPWVFMVYKSLRKKKREINTEARCFNSTNRCNGVWCLGRSPALWEVHLETTESSVTSRPPITGWGGRLTKSLLCLCCCREQEVCVCVQPLGGATVHFPHRLLCFASASWATVTLRLPGLHIKQCCSVKNNYKYRFKSNHKLCFEKEFKTFKHQI